MKMAANETGGMILIHFHDNKEVLDALAEQFGQLYYNGKPVMTPISKQANNAMQEASDGLFVDGSYFLDKTHFDIVSDFKYENGVLYHKKKVVSQEYTELQMQLAVAEVWSLIDQTEGLEWITPIKEEDEDNDTGES